MNFRGLYELPGEGLVAEFRADRKLVLFDRQGLQWRIVDRKQHGKDTSEEERALAQINALSRSQEFPDID